MRYQKIGLLLLIIITILSVGCRKSEEDKAFIMESIDWNQNGVDDLLIHYGGEKDTFDIQNFCIYQAEGKDEWQVTELPTGKLIYDDENQRLYVQVDPEEARYRYEAYQIKDYEASWDKTMSIMGDERQTIYTVWDQRSTSQWAHYLNCLVEEEQIYWATVIPDE